MAIKASHPPSSFSFCQFNVDKPHNPRSHMLKMVGLQVGRIWISESPFGVELITNQEHLFLTFNDWEKTFCYVWPIAHFGISFIVAALLS